MSGVATDGIVSAYLRFVSAVAPMLTRGLFGRESFIDGRDEADAAAAIAALDIVQRACSGQSDLHLDQGAIEDLVYREVLLPRFPHMTSDRVGVRREAVQLFDSMLRDLSMSDLMVALVAFPYEGRLPGETMVAAAIDVAGALAAAAGKHAASSSWFLEFSEHVQAIAKDPHGLLSSEGSRGE